MKNLLFGLILAFMAISVNAQDTHCYYSSDYYHTTTTMKGVAKLKAKAYFCFNNGAATLLTKETGLITFNYMDLGSGQDTLGQMWWQGGNDKYTIDMTYNHVIKVQANSGAWCVWLWSPCSTEGGCVDLQRKQTHKEYVH